MQKHVLEKLRDYPSNIRNIKELQRFLRLLTYISSEGFIKELAKERRMLQLKLKKDAPWHWTEEDKLMVERLKVFCQNLPELYNPSEDNIIIVETDALNNT